MTRLAGQAPTAQHSPESEVRDVTGIGFGAANLALAVALHESGAGDRALFLEKQKEFGWHRGMLIEGSSLQVSFLKDIATMRNPTSDFGFLSYLQEKGRLVDFINQHTLLPSRIEYHDYLQWAADRLGHMVEYGVEATGVRPVTDAGEVVALDVLAGDRVVTRTRNLVIASGLRPRLPEGAETGERVWHSSQLLHRLPAFDERPPRRAVVVGAGQSAAEVAAHLMERYPQAEVCAVFSRYGYSVADSSPFANRVFDPAAVDDFYFAPPEVKQAIMRYHGGTNYAVVDEDVLQGLYRRQYEQKVTGTPRLRVMNASRLVSVEPRGETAAVRVEFLPTGEHADLDADLVVYATGYRSADPAELLGGVAGSLRRDAAGQVLIGRDYRLSTTGDFRCGIYVQGATEATHGIASTLLSMVAVRAGEIAQSIIGGRRDPDRTAGTKAVAGNRG
ncbi:MULTISPECIES: lysine N(6)-hydroxylase/L-ornithine N(5)-oxygenase family protein [Streptomyces]|uniref:L-lysine N6-monooxygenase MbtG n=1 Tax=Streptomyces bangladeshensis TaxID=295352 RepID=A0ABN1ZKK9_9ACTN|nr:MULTISPECIES: SidA/IucD/PvdA family monooxygenase [unclassified Streptomyces]MYU27552.1 SidA/IucD/PvdA family monooxygenase [Streptomyces sp. SID7810]OYP19421.1 L-lysine 6-monooxygenase [Streptomyces sp. FBKL.4005]BCM72235.1 putative peptide monooxygenase [Streptomyces sp. EAS-AB2608]CUW26412.1 L-ornithine 5-monooxygenase [Streptomyces reticuli]